MEISKWALKKPLYVTEDDDRYKDQLWQLKEFGFSDSETWTLFLVIAEFVLPRLIEFRKIHPDYLPEKSFDEWNEILDKMIFSFEWVVKSDKMTGNYKDLSDEEKDDCWKKYQEGMDLFSKYFMHLWW